MNRKLHSQQIREQYPSLDAYQYEALYSLACREGQHLGWDAIKKEMDRLYEAIKAHSYSDVMLEALMNKSPFDELFG